MSSHKFAEFDYSKTEEPEVLDALEMREPAEEQTNTAEAGSQAASTTTSAPSSSMVGSSLAKKSVVDSSSEKLLGILELGEAPHHPLTPGHSPESPPRPKPTGFADSSVVTQSEMPASTHKSADGIMEYDSYYPYYMNTTGHNDRLSSIASDMTPKRYYAVARGRRPGIYTNVAVALQQTLGFSGFVLRRFGTLQQAMAFMRDNEVDLVDDWKFFDEIVGNFESPTVQIFIAACCERDGLPDARAGYALTLPERPEMETQRVLPELQHPHTVYCAEYAAVLEAMHLAQGATTLEIVTSSRLLIGQLTKHIIKWRINGWIACTGYPLVYRLLLSKMNARFSSFTSVRFLHLSEVADGALHHSHAYARAQAVLG